MIKHVNRVLSAAVAQAGRLSRIGLVRVSFGVPLPVFTFLCGIRSPGDHARGSSARRMRACAGT
jgi:hypothetical protein